MTVVPAPCPSCGAPLGGRAGCQAVFDRLSAEAWSSPARATVHNLLVDVYAMQHPEEYGVSAKSYAAHLTALLCGVEHAGDRKLYWAIARSLDGPTTVVKPALVMSRGRLTIADVDAPASDAEYPARVRRWARDVWTAYADQHALARVYLLAARTSRSAW